MKSRRSGAVGGDDGFEVVAFPTLLLTISVCSEGSGCRNLFGLANGGFFDVGAVHHGKGRGVGGQQILRIESDWSLCRASFR